ncbi:MAG: S1 RNA-binding domain-containing protein [Verrucomicrobiota bacterium]
MRVILTQSRGQEVLRGWILFRIEASDICTQIWTSSTFDPYKEIYTWLGQIRDSQLPARMIIDEEGRGVEFSAEQVSAELLNFCIEPWPCNSGDLTHFDITIKKDELINAFCNGILEFIKDDYSIPEWSYVDDLSNLNWNALLQSESHPVQKWQTRLAIYGGGHGRVPHTGRKCLEKSLTTEQQWLLVLYDAFYKIILSASSGQLYESYALASLYQNLLADLILNELDSDWYKKRISEIDQGFGDLRSFSPKRDPKRVGRETQVRLATLQLGQLVDGRVCQIKPYGVFIDIGGFHALLSVSTISQLPLESLEQIFQVGDWVRAIIVWMDIEKGRVLLSTSDLESEPGDMLCNPLCVYERAEEMASRYRQNVLSKLADE